MIFGRNNQLGVLGRSGTREGAGNESARAAWAIVSGGARWVWWLSRVVLLPFFLLIYWLELLALSPLFGAVLLVVWAAEGTAGIKKSAKQIPLWPDRLPIGRQLMSRPQTNVVRSLLWLVARRWQQGQ